MNASCIARPHSGILVRKKFCEMIALGIEGLPGGSADVTVIGAGPAGITLALECARHGQSVLLLESGDNGALKKAQDLSLATLVDPHTHYDMAVSVARRFGGTSNLWGGRCQQLDPIDFTERPGLVEAKWPFGLEQLLPFYGIACRYASCGSPVFTAPVGDSICDPKLVEASPIARFSNQPRFHIAHKNSFCSSQVDVRLNVTVTDFELHESGHIKALTVAGPDRERHRIPVNRVAIACGGLESTRLLLCLQRKHPELFGGTNGPLGRYYMGHLIGEIADIKFATDRVARAFDFFVDGNGSYVRRRMVPSDEAQRCRHLLNCSFGPVVLPVSDATHGSGLLSLAYLAVARSALSRMLVAEAVRIRHSRPDVALLPHVKNVLFELPSAATYLPRFIYGKFFSQVRLPGFFVLNSERRYGLSYHQEQVPDPYSRVWLNDDVDSLGVPRLSIHLKFDRRNAEALVRSHRLLEEWLEQKKVGRLHYRYPQEELEDAVQEQAAHGRHQIGTARMGFYRRSAVVDKNLRTFDVPNLHVLSSAVMPTSGQAGPTLTVVALAARLAEHLHAVH
jgi:GMC oxidoreductase/FAD dependent oxidoreductase